MCICWFSAYFLNPKYHYGRNLFEDNSLKRVVHKVYDHLFLDCPGKGTFGSEIVKFRDAVGMFGCHPAMKSRNAMMPCEWWSMYGTDCEVLQQLVVCVLAQTVSSSPCERNWSTFSLIHTNKRNKIGYERLQKLVTARIIIANPSTSMGNVDEVFPFESLGWDRGSTGSSEYLDSFYQSTIFRGSRWLEHRDLREKTAFQRDWGWYCYCVRLLPLSCPCGNGPPLLNSEVDEELRN
ncbi:uncharacterized protein LOC131244185 [Magnolia sinica]|uniref:uncharacterized protein LOC131244185 n=1 Tax=Magnolia sinica TaxID=86752 RepID=UPI002657FC02|nr:uncharacterized protein LOC131244185 [Magnolia sinica]